MSSNNDGLEDEPYTQANGIINETSTLSTTPAASESLRSPGTADSAGPVAELRDLCKTYFKPDGTVLVAALKNVSMKIHPGEYLAIMGASGSGKSTMMNVLGCLDRPTSGEYFLDGKDVAGMDDDELSRVRGQKIGFVFQAFNLISELNIVDNVLVPLFYQGVPRAERIRRAIEKLEIVGLGDRLTHRPKELSGGQQQRVAIARALVNEPSIIMADEPTGNLDSKTSEQILNLFDDLHDAGMTIIMVTHDDEMAEHCERIVRLHDGEIQSDKPGGRALRNGQAR